MDRNEALKLLRGGPEGIAEWNRRPKSDRRLPNLLGANLEGVDLRNSFLKGLDLQGCNLSDANLSDAILLGANLYRANLYQAVMRNASFYRANLARAKLTGADLSGADLYGANLRGADLDGTIFDDARCWNTVFANVDLSSAKGLNAIAHRGPSEIGVNTIMLSQGKIPESFLRGCGLPDAWIANLPALIGALEPIQFYSVFISYSSKDTGFAERLHADLQAKGVRCWFAPEDLKIGERIRVGIDEAIRVHDKLLLVLSKHSVASDWVEKEVETAMEQERRQKRTVLFPIRLDEGVMKAEVGWAADIRRSRNVGDFRKWKDHDTYQKAFDRLLRDLKAEDSRA